MEDPLTGSDDDVTIGNNFSSFPPTGNYFPVPSRVPADDRVRRARR